ncbi:MAG TPA: ABC transporter permease [Terriglobales bacterium]|nr:ABC transporter permease [Terriglobales bacterium]
MNISSKRKLAFTSRLYRSLASAFPREFKNLYGEELLQAGDGAIQFAAEEYGVVGVIRLLWDIACRIPAEYAAEIRQDLRFGLRTLAKSPGFTAVALISLTLGICIATCAISEMNGIVLRNLPEVPHPEQLVALLAPTSYPNFESYRDRKDLFSSTAAYVAPVSFAVVLGARSERTFGQLVTPSYFETYEVVPVLGRFFSADEEQTDRAPNVVVSYRFWTDNLGSDPQVVGKALTLNGHPATVIGVAPENFFGASPALFAADIWLPMFAGEAIAPELSDGALTRRDVALFRVVGRLQPGVTASRAEAALDAITQQLEQDNGEKQSKRRGRRVFLVDGGKLLPLRKQDRPFFTSFLLLMAGLVVLIACANVANMMLARATERRREIAVRLSLGASRARLVRQLVTENMIIAAAAGVLGLLASAWLMHLLSQLRLPLPMPVSYDLTPDAHVLFFSMALTLMTGFFFGLAPALHATGPHIAEALKDGRDVRFTKFRRIGLRNLLMVSQVAGSLTVLIVLALMSIGIQTTMGVRAGFDARNLYLLSMDPVRDGYPSEKVGDFLEKLLERLQALPTVAAATLTESIPVSLPSRFVSLSAPTDRFGHSEIADAVASHVVGKDYFETTGVPIQLGRAFLRSDETSDTKAVIVSQALVQKLWPGENPIGRRVEIANDALTPPKILPGSFDYRAQVGTGDVQGYQVVGVAGDVAEGLVVQKPRPAVYFPLNGSTFQRPSLDGVTLIVRGTPGANPTDAVQNEITRLSANVTPFNVMSMNEHIEQFMSPLKMAAWTYGAIGIFGLLLACVGLAGMSAYSVSQRRQELAVRLAMGAQKRDVLRLVIGEGSFLLILGSIWGIMLALAAERALSAMSSTAGQVNSTSSSNPVVLIGAPLLLIALGLLACYLPARQSALIDPAHALRQE